VDTDELVALKKFRKKFPDWKSACKLTHFFPR